ncbi:hypothetical protein LMG28688_07177 [Paraburkholderia caffeinitolerans]|uniref:Uncharacterized protein n=1 Tax=Paraburkholderia caffeinitolerans TaxID=1723730 RepID=A0A6J5H1V5_9BURK|nr:hypothetical protein [Paraburkholderia caffeinitolerans]CAB3810196.1 hypothetical protein LMG28688_07177 [Paraburkholderia caffeinitolerans]
MTDCTCDRCGAVTPPHDVVSVASPDGPFRLLCSRCFNTGMAHLAEIRAFEHPQFTPMRLADADGVVHEFHFRSFLFGDQRSLEAFEPGIHEEDGAGFRFQLLGDPQSDPFELLGELVQKIKRCLAVRHLVERSDRLELAGTTVRGRIEWDGNDDGRMPCVVIDGRRVDWTDFGRMLMAFEGWQFRIELVDPGDEA